MMYFDFHFMPTILYRSVSDFHGFVSGIIAEGGRDDPEDVMGGLNVVFTHLHWRQESTKVAI